MNRSLFLVVFIGLIASGFSFKLGDHDHEHDAGHAHEEHEHANEHEHDHSNEDHHHEEAREGKAEALASDFQNSFVDAGTSGLAVDFSRFDSIFGML